MRGGGRRYDRTIVRRKGVFVCVIAITERGGQQFFKPKGGTLIFFNFFFSVGLNDFLHFFHDGRLFERCCTNSFTEDGPLSPDEKNNSFKELFLLETEEGRRRRRRGEGCQVYYDGETSWELEERYARDRKVQTRNEQ